MEKRIKQCVGIDCGLKELVVCYSIMDKKFDVEALSTMTFKNNLAGFKRLQVWSKKLNKNSGEVSYVIEATGVYHEAISVFLHKQKHSIAVVLPNRANAFLRTLPVKTITDKVSAQVLAQMGLEKKLDAWSPPREEYKILRQLTRERDQLLAERTQVKNQLHAEESGAWPNPQSLKRTNQRINYISKQIKEIEQEIKDYLQKQPAIEHKLDKVLTIPGVGLMTAVTVIAETDGFHLIRNKNQLVSYAGLDILVKESGSSVKTKPRISKKGNRFLRKCLHFPALAAIRSTDTMRALFKRLVSKHGIKMKAVVAVQRKLLVLIYTLWKKDEIFDKEYPIKRKESASANSCELA